MNKKQLIESIRNIISNNSKKISDLNILNYNRFIEIRMILSYVTKLNQQSKNDLIIILNDLKNCLQIS